MNVSSVFKSLSSQELQLIIDAFPAIAVLISGADGTIDLTEKEWAEKIVKIRAYAHHFDLKPLFQQLEQDFRMKLDALIASLPKETEARNKVLSGELSKLNYILPKLPISVASQLYNSYISYAEQIAKSSSGFMRMMSVSQEESIWIGLPMLDPIFYDDNEEE